MTRCLSVLLCLLTVNGAVFGNDWPWWRGPDRNGIAEADQMPPVEFSATKNVRWVVRVPGRGHGSPTVVGPRVFLAVADEEKKTQGLLCLERDSGKELWSTVLHEGGFPEINKKASHASSTPACDGERVFIGFVNSGAAHLNALSLEGKPLWRAKVCDYTVHQGYSTSPTIYESLVIVAADNKAGGAIAAYNREDGELVWKVERPKFPNYHSPIIHRLGGRDQLLFQGCDLVTSLDPMTGDKLWETAGSTTECVASLATDGERVFTSGGYPKNHVAAMRADGSGTIEWENTSRVYVPSMLVKDGYLYAVMDSGVAMCWDCETGETLWKERLGRGTSSSPVLVGDHIFSGDEYGQFSVFVADPKAFRIVAANQLGDEVLSTPTICGGRIFARVAERDGDTRQEKLYCLEVE